MCELNQKLHSLLRFELDHFSCNTFATNSMNAFSNFSSVNFILWFQFLLFPEQLPFLCCKLNGLPKEGAVLFIFIGNEKL